MPETPTLRVDQLTKRYGGGTLALRGVSFQASTGLIGLLGPNGAGKTTLMRILSTIHHPTSGALYWNGRDVFRAPSDFRQTLGYLPQEFSAPPLFSSYQVVERFAALKGWQGADRKQRVLETLDTVGLRQDAERKVGAFSGGMLRRLGIAQAIVHQPQVIIVDEPTAGLDPEERVRFRKLLADLARDRLVLLSTHIVADIEAIADRVIALSHGAVISDSLTSELIDRAKGYVWRTVVSPAEFRDAQRDSAYQVVSATQRADGVAIRLLSAKPPPWQDAAPDIPTLEDAYLVLMAEHGGVEYGAV